MMDCTNPLTCWTSGQAITQSNSSLVGSGTSLFNGPSVFLTLVTS